MSKRVQLLCLVFIGLCLAAATSHFRQAAPVPGGSEARRYLYCPECGLEMTYPLDPDRKQTFCPHCGVNQPLQINTFSRTNGEGPPLMTNRLFVAAMFGVPAALAIGVYSLGRVRGQQVSSDGSDVLQFSCPGCGHTIASNSYREGSTAVCPSCAEMFVVGGSKTTDTTVAKPDEEREWQTELQSALRKKRTAGPRRSRP